MSKTSPETALNLIKSNKAQGRMSVENPEELMEKLTKRYGENAPDLVVRAIKEPTTLMNSIGEKEASSAATLNYLAGPDISNENIAKLGGTIEQASTGFKLEPLSQEEAQTFNTNSPQTQETAPQPASPDLSQMGNVDVYGNQVQSQDQSGSSSSSSSDTDNYQTDTQEPQQPADPWSELFNNLMSGDLGQMLGAALALQMLNQAHLAFGPHYCPFPHHCHPYRDRIDHFDHCVDNRSKTEKVLDKVADVAHGVGILAHGTGHLIDAIKGHGRH